ncbi:S-adenosylmethionine:tRNA ribosyltransferase-isomerase [Couchioplanes caeruleus]|uniref:S-adenosylmethionine:tRNA ribosyltransferase-isomerase n=1 Tax=Couchioplanes caeruleus TaxID=56438 RepID=UPI0020C0188E|nr:S-adenosylmethionine:tRNA ribosyltransferase-isomerase [Couchioplanes caeruleus]UQU61592.1 S-adenosylmethionine:tRNA ribosyltransferase-isomerase [Couchioplanes caeruleus]
MTATLPAFELPARLEADRPPEPRDGVRMLTARRGTGAIGHHRFTDLPGVLRAGDVLVVNTSGTLPAAVPVAGSPLSVHFSTATADGAWLIELRGPAGPYAGAAPGERYALAGGGAVTLREAYSRGRLWVADVDTGAAATVTDYLYAHGAPIRYSYVPRPWPLSAYQTVFGVHPGSAEMPSAGRPFTHELVTRLVTAGVLLAPVLLHTGVASPEAHERPYPERFAVPATTLRTVADAKADGGRVIAVGTTAVRALETAWDGPASGWTDLVVTPERGVRVVDGLLTGFHEPRASHLDMLAAIAGTPLLRRCYEAALEGGYRWHEFGDVNLLLP